MPEDEVRKPTAFLLFIALCCTLMVHADERYRIRLGSSVIEPERGSISRTIATDEYCIVQFQRIPDESARARLSAAGLVFHRYVGGTAWLVRRNAAVAPAALDLGEKDGVRAIIPFTPSMKRAAILDSDRLIASALRRGERVPLRIRFFPEGAQGNALHILKEAGLTISADYRASSNALEAACSLVELEELLTNPAVELVEPALPPSRTYNSGAASRTGADAVRRIAAFRSADGASVRVGVWDGGPIISHPDFGDRVTIVETGGGSTHATHVGGTIAGGGLGNGEALGMAPAARLWSYNFNGDVVAEKNAAVTQYGLGITNNSWGSISGWDSDEEDDGSIYWRWVGDWMFGYYHDSAAALDTLIRDRDLLVVFAAANDRGDHYIGPHYHDYARTTLFNDTHPADPEYRSIPTWGNAKNSLTIGATHKDDVITSFSGWGPTADGRIKPDVVAPGYNLLSTYSNGSYAKSSGTSMATPTVSGVAALLGDYYQRRHGAAISALALKTLLIHSARDLGAAGPDFIYGHGMVDAGLAARVIRTAVFKAGDFGVQPKPKVDRDADMSSLIIEDSVGQGGAKIYKIVVPEGRAELRATLVWFDPAGTVLINNLDLSMKRKGVPLARPLVPDPADPAAAAVRRINSRDTVETIRLEEAEGGKWRIFVRGVAVPQGPQKFCLIVSAGDGNEPPALKTGNTFELLRVHPSSDSDWNAVAEKTSFATGEDLWFYTYLNVSSNAAYNEWYGTMLERWTVKNAAGDIVFETFYSSDGFYARPNYWRWRLGPYEIPSGMARGNYTLEVRVISFTGETQTAECAFTVR